MKKETKLTIIATQIVTITAVFVAIYHSSEKGQVYKSGVADQEYRLSGHVDFESVHTTINYQESTTDTVATSLGGNYIRLHGNNMGYYNDTAYPIAFSGSTSYAVFVKENGTPFDFSGSRIRRISLYKAVYSTVSFKLLYKLEGDEEFRETAEMDCTTENKEYTIYLSGDTGITGIKELRIVSASDTSNGCFSRVTIGYYCGLIN